VDNAADAVICARLMRARIRADMQYRLSFWLRLASSSAVLFVDAFSTWALVHRFGSIGGWTLWPLAFLLGTVTTSFRLADGLIGGSIERCAELVRTGKLDSMLTRPVGVMWQLMGEGFAIRRVMQFFTVLPIMIVAVTHVDVEWGLGRIGILLLLLVNASVTFACIFVVSNTLSFWSPNTAEVANAFTYGGGTVAEYPIHVMDRWVRLITMSVVPVAFSVYIPSFLILRSVPNPLHITPLQSWLSLLTCIPMTIGARSIWHFALRRYRSTGS
jgi:ABC-2 type transport system permease protein